MIGKGKKMSKVFKGRSDRENSKEKDIVQEAKEVSKNSDSKKKEASLQSGSDKKKKAETKEPLTKIENLKRNYRALQEQHRVVTVLGGQHRKELAQLRRMEDLFCKHYELDMKKWKEGEYAWDAKNEAFVERKKAKKEAAPEETPAEVAV